MSEEGLGNYRTDSLLAHASRDNRMTIVHICYIDIIIILYYEIWGKLNTIF